MTEDQTWVLHFAHPSVERYIAGLQAETRVKLLRHLQRLETLGNTLRQPHSRAIARGLFELRVPGKDAQRVNYSLLPGRQILVLQVGSKGTQKRDIEVAMQRMGNRYATE